VKIKAGRILCTCASTKKGVVNFYIVENVRGDLATIYTLKKVEEETEKGKVLLPLSNEPIYSTMDFLKIRKNKDYELVFISDDENAKVWDGKAISV
jgi:hypothetical protein